MGYTVSSILTVVIAIACNYRGCVPIERTNPIICEHVYFYFVINLGRPSHNRWGADTCWINHAMSLCTWGRLGLGFFIVHFIVRHIATQQLLDLVANTTAGPCFRVKVRVFHPPFIVRHMAAQQPLHLVANATVGPCFRVGLGFFIRPFIVRHMAAQRLLDFAGPCLRIRVRVFHHTC